MWHQYPDISLLLNFYRESKFAVRFILGAFIFEIAQYFQESPPGGSDKFEFLNFPPSHPKLVSAIATRWLSCIQLDVLPLRVEHKLRHWPNVAHAFIHWLTHQKPLFCHSKPSFWLASLDSGNAGFWLVCVGYKYKVRQEKPSVDSRPPTWKDLTQSKCQPDS